MAEPTDYVEDVLTALRGLPEVSEKVFHVYTQEDLISTTASIVYPVLGVLYEGLRSKPDATDKGTPQGLSNDLHVAVLLLVAGKSFGNVDLRSVGMQFCSKIRKALKLRRAPGGHFWKFVAEAPVVDMQGAFGYYVRFKTTHIES